MNLWQNYTNKEIYLFSYLLLINALALILFGLDKSRAKRKSWRIRENLLILTALLGGGTGSLMAMVIFKHKLSKKKFSLGLPLIIILNQIIKLGLWTYIKK